MHVLTKDGLLKGSYCVSICSNDLLFAVSIFSVIINLVILCICL